MITFNQLALKYRNSIYKKRGLLYTRPQQLAYCIRTVIRSPKKPNSARRKVIQAWFIRRRYNVYVDLNRADMSLLKIFRVYCYLPGIGTKVFPGAAVFFRGGRVKDLPGIRYHVICGVYDVKPVQDRRKARSKYGVKKFID